MNNNNNNNEISFSVLIANAHSCNMNCRYCAGADDVKINHEFSKPYPINWNKLISEMKRSPYLKINDDGTNNIGHIEIWGGEPLLYLDTMIELCDRFNKEFNIKRFFFSTNGIKLADNKVVDWIMDESKYHVDFQLSHDGLGQWIRSGEFDPLYSNLTRDNIIKLAKANHFADINCVLCYLNPSPIDNISYFNKWISDYGVRPRAGIQLNHMQDTPNIIKHLVNPHTGEEWNNISLNLTGNPLNTFIYEFESLFIEMFIAGRFNDISLAPYSAYIEGFLRGHGGWINSKDDDIGSCRSFSRGKKDTNFAIDTLGNYCECILYDSTQKTPNHSCEQPEYCKDCEFYNYKACNGCSDQWYMPIKNSDECQFRKEYARLLERINQLDTTLSRGNNNNNNCNCNEEAKK